MLSIVYGPDDYRAQAEAESLVRASLSEGDAGGLSRLDGAAASWDSVRYACVNQSLFSSIQVVLVRGLLGRWTGKSDDGSAATGKPSPADFAAFAEALPTTTHLILVEGELRADSRYLKPLAALGPDRARIQSFSRLKEAALTDWIQRETRLRGGSVDFEAAELLAARVPDNLALLSQEIDKILCYTAPGGHIRRDDVRLLAPEAANTNVFGLIDAVGAKKPADAALLTHSLLEAGQAPEQLMALMVGRVRDLLLLATGQAEGVAAAQVAANAGWSDGRRFQVTRGRSDFTLPELIDAHTLLLAADHALKSRPAYERATVTLVTFLTIAQRAESAALAEALPLGI
ncbi:MAG TPA: DNA polymerase III subunit delta [Chloroflexota bacterium]|nr:DNA polymerase III subunit delta [Chloroflexota bacterium]